MNIVKWLKRLLGWNQIDRNLITMEFWQFRRNVEIANDITGNYDSEANIVARYFKETKISPFVGDDDLEEVKKYLIEKHITPGESF